MSITWKYRHACKLLWIGFMAEGINQMEAVIRACELLLDPLH